MPAISRIFIRFALKAFPVFLLLTTALEVCVAQPATKEEIAVQYFQNQEYDKAAVLFEELWDKKPDPFIYNYYLDCLLAMAEYRKAEKFVSRQVKRQPGNPVYLVDLGYVYRRAGETENSRNQYEQAIQNLVAAESPITDLANAFLRRDEKEYAVKTFQSGRKLLKIKGGFESQLAEIYIALNNFSSALDEYLNWIDSDNAPVEQIQSRLQDLLASDPEGTRNETFKNTLFQRIKKQPERKTFPELLLWYFIQQKDFEAALTQARSLDKRFNEDGARIMDLGKIATDNKAWDDAIACFDYIITRKGEMCPFYQSARVEKLNTRFLKISDSYKPLHSDLVLLEDEYRQMISENGESQIMARLLLNLAHLQAFYLDKTRDAKDQLNRAVALPNVAPALIARCKLELGDILLFTGDVWEASLLYMQVEKAFKNDAVGHEAKFRNARLYYYIKEFEYARAQLDVLKAATSKLISNDAIELSLLIADNMDPDSTTFGLSYFAKAEMLIYQRNDSLALIVLDSVNTLGAWHPLFDEVLYKKAEIMMRKGNYSLAAELLEKLISFYPDDILADDALYTLAGLYEGPLGDSNKAMQLFQQLITEYPGSTFVVDARKRFRVLRGDKVN